MTAADLDRRIAELANFSREELKACWCEHYGCTAPKGLSRRLLLRALAYEMQAKCLGCLAPATQRQLARAAKEIKLGQVPSAPPAAIKPGTRLLREWQGVTHEVIVLESGVQHRGKTWPSLSAVAREITGTRWSGPRFFGLKGRRLEGR